MQQLARLERLIGIGTQQIAEAEVALIALQARHWGDRKFLAEMRVLETDIAMAKRLNEAWKAERDELIVSATISQGALLAGLRGNEVSPTSA